jgi:hypothetical protein
MNFDTTINRQQPTRGRKVPNSWFQGDFCIKEKEFGRNAYVQGEFAFMLWELFFT